jgi:hypothetical protein
MAVTGCLEASERPIRLDEKKVSVVKSATLNEPCLIDENDIVRPFIFQASGHLKSKFYKIRSCRTVSYNGCLTIITRIKFDMMRRVRQCDAVPRLGEEQLSTAG